MKWKGWNFLYICLAIATLSACGPSKEVQEMMWREQVQLADGTKLVVQRRLNGSHVSEAGGPTSFISSGSEVAMDSQSEAAGFETLRAGKKERMLILDRDADGWYAISVLDWCAEAKAQSLGKRPYLEYRLSRGKWSRQLAPESRIGQPSNLLQTILKTDRGRLIEFAEKEHRHSSSGVADYVKKIVPVVCPEN